MASQSHAAAESSLATPAANAVGGVGHGGCGAGETSDAVGGFMDRQSVLTFIYKHRRDGHLSFLHAPSAARFASASSLSTLLQALCP